MEFLHDHTCIPVIITWNGQMDVTAGGKSLSSGQQVLEGTTITITPSQEGDPVAEFAR